MSTTSFDRLVQGYEQLSPNSLNELMSLYSDDAFFKDPFNEVRGKAQIQAIFDDMFEHLHEPRFVITHRVTQADHMVLMWDMHLSLKGKRAQRRHIIRGCTHLRCNSQGLIDWHRDYWDTGEELYVHVPVLGAVIRAIRRKLRTVTNPKSPAH